MPWIPIGPDFVLNPKNPNYLRVSRRNLFGAQCQVESIALDPTDPRTLYIVNRPGGGGTSAFRTRDDGSSWSSILDRLQRVDPRVDPSVIAVHPVHPETIYMATLATMNFYVSHDRGDSWSTPVSLGGSVHRIVVAPGPTGALGSTRIFAATTAGLFISDDGGASWPSTPAVAGDVYSFVAWLPPTGERRYYAGVSSSGLWYATDPARWVNLSVGATPASAHLPAHNPATDYGNFDRLFVDFSRLNPDRAYVWLTRPDQFVALYTTTEVTGVWTKVEVRSHGTGDGSAGGPGPAYGYYAIAFAVAANSPGTGDGSSDILLIGSETLWRSTDGGRTWSDDRGFMSDFHAIVCEPVGDRVPMVYIGCDGGIARSSGAADPAVVLPPSGVYPPGGYNELRTVDSNNPIWQTLDMGLPAIAPYTYGCDPAIGALHFAACQDTGVAAGAGGSHAWHTLDVGGDGFQVAVAQGADGVKLWVHHNASLTLFTDQGRLHPPSVGIFLGPGGPGVLSTSNLVIDSGGFCIAGATWTPAGGSAQGGVVRIDQNGIAMNISETFALSDRQASIVAVHPTDASVVYFATSDTGLWRTGPGPSSIEIALPAGLPQIKSIAIDRAGTVLALVNQSTVDASPVLHVVGGSAMIEPARFPDGTVFDLPFNFGPLVAHPSAAGVFFAGHGARVYKIVFQQNVWEFFDVSDGLPGQWIYDLCAVALGGTGTPPREVLRVAIPSRGIYEREMPNSIVPPAEALYVRDNVLDSWWSNPSPEGVNSPFDPANPGETLFHYLCSDIKVDARRPGLTVDDFFQTDPETLPHLGVLDPDHPMTQVIFGLLVDNSRHLPGDDAAWVHVQVHNYSNLASEAVRVWALFTNAAAGVPSLNARSDMSTPYDFWSQFHDGGMIIPRLPDGSPWTPVGPPITLDAISAAAPQVASWPWTVPRPAADDPGHYCIVAFVHSESSPLAPGSADVDDIVPRTKQIGQKNLHIGAPLSTSSMSLLDLFGPWGDGRVYETIEFHNPTGTERIATLVFDLRGLPPELGLGFTLSRITPPAASLSGVLRSVREPDLPRGASFLRRLRWWLFGRRMRTIFEAKRSTLVEVRDIRLPAYGFCTAHFAVQSTGELPKGSRYQFHVQQKVKEKVVGGSVYVLEIEGEPSFEALEPMEVEELEVEERIAQVRVYQRKTVAQRIRESGRS